MPESVRFKYSAYCVEQEGAGHGQKIMLFHESAGAAVTLAHAHQGAVVGRWWYPPRPEKSPYVVRRGDAMLCFDGEFRRPGLSKSEGSGEQGR